jgi:cysteine synthase
MNFRILDDSIELLNQINFLHLNPLINEPDIADIYVGLLHLLPTGSHKVLAALSMIEEKERNTAISDKTIFIDHSTGNAASAEAWVCAKKGYKYLAFIPENMAQEKLQQIKALGGEIILTKANDFIAGAKSAAAKYQSIDPENRIYLNQTANPMSPQGYSEFGYAIAKYFPNINAYVCGSGTYSTITGVARSLKNTGREIEIFCIEAVYAPYLHAQRNGYVSNFQKHNLIGFGAESLSINAEPDLYDHIVLIDEQDSIETMKMLHKKGLLVGKTSSANIHWALKIAKRLGKGKCVVTNTFDCFSKIISEHLY